MLKDVLVMEDICGLLQYINGDLNDESDDLIDDSQLYFLFLRLALCHVRTHTPFEEDVYLNEILLDYQEPIPDAKQRVAEVLRIMLTAWAAAQLKHKAQQLLVTINEKGEM